MTATRDCVLVSGGSGFVGACLVRRLIAEGREVHLLLRRAGTPWQLAGLEGRYVHHTGDLRDAGAVRAAVRACRPAVVFHAAAHGAKGGGHDRADILTANLLGTANLLDAVAEFEYRAFIHTGSSSEYGHKRGPMRLDDPLQPRTDYAVAKAAATLLCQAEAYRGRPVTTVRIFSAYGPWDDPGRLVSSVMLALQRGQAPRVSAGMQPRDWIHIEDAIDLALKAASDPRAAGPIVNAGSGRRQTVREMVETIVEIHGGGLRPLYGEAPLRGGEPEEWLADISETTARTGWKPALDLRAGVARTWHWFRGEGVQAPRRAA